MEQLVIKKRKEEERMDIPETSGGEASTQEDLQTLGCLKWKRKKKYDFHLYEKKLFKQNQFYYLS